MPTQLGIKDNKRWLYASGVTDPVEPEGLQALRGEDEDEESTGTENGEPVVAEEDSPDLPDEEAAPEAEPAPNSSWLKADIQAWLTDHDIEWDPGMLKDELLALVEE